MDEPTGTGSIMTTNFMFPAEFIGFQGHFPSKMVLPGVCQIQCSLLTLEKAFKKRVVLREIQQAKYLSPVVPGDRVTCTVSGAPDSHGELICKARLAKGEKKVADLKMRISLGDAL